MNNESRFVRLEDWEAERMPDPEFIAALAARVELRLSPLEDASSARA